ncbi:helix-turn-helix transcriptional regulator [Micromonospora aurantiaca (nom. illeg.)]|uniref:helix-turn-helix transcriptional regulator n=1 Tax=Micromonospora aurantiaca (nom. illeg.) TaxID=47850 RepID=UPI0036888BBB
MNSPTNHDDETTRTTTDSTTTAPGIGEVWTIERIRALGVTTTLATTASVLGISRSQAYRLAATDQFPVPLIRAGSRIVVPVAALLHLLQPEPAATGGGRLDADAKVSVDAVTPPPADSTRHRWRHHTKHPGDDE